ncbi:MAG: M55 family metallopeptidase [Armatimonadota bacterium]
MRVLIIGDMEGVAGIVRWSQVNGGEPMYEEGRRLYTEEINAAVRGALASGATEVVVVDGHGAGGDWSFNSLIPELLHPHCEWVVQNEWTEYTAFLEQGCDAALLVGMHAKAGSDRGVLSHTVSSQRWKNLWFNGTLVGETAINAALCGTWGCPIGLVTGDTQVCQEATDLLGDELTTVAVKQGLGRNSARQFPPIRAREMIESGAKQALINLQALKPYSPGDPCEIKVEFVATETAVLFSCKHKVESLGPRMIVSSGDDWWSAWKQMYF